jgi:hypothetical protein
MLNGRDKYNTLQKKLQRVLHELGEVEAEIRDMESVWGGPPNRVNLARYMHDPVMWNTVVIARNRYAHLMEERETLREIAYALQQRLQEVAE